MTPKLYYLALASTFFQFLLLFFLSAYSELEIYWVSYALAHLAFWVSILYPNYRWNSFNLLKKIAVAAIAINFCLYFLPIGHNTLANNILDWVAVFGLIWDRDDDDDDDDDGDELRDREARPKREWGFWLRPNTPLAF